MTLTNIVLTTVTIHQTHTLRKRMLFYMWDHLSDDEESQKLGFVLILNLTNLIDCANDLKDKQVIAELLESFPGRYSAMHLCFPDNTPFFGAIKGTFLLLLGKENRSRVRFHEGKIRTVCCLSSR